MTSKTFLIAPTERKILFLWQKGPEQTHKLFLCVTGLQPPHEHNLNYLTNLYSV